MNHIRHDAYGCLPMAALFIGLCGLAWWLASPAKAQSFTMITPLPCLKTEELLKTLANKYHEETVGAGVSGLGEHIRLFVSPKNTFTIIGTKPGATFSCLYTGGDGWVINGIPKGDDL